MEYIPVYTDMTVKQAKESLAQMKKKFIEAPEEAAEARDWSLAVRYGTSGKKIAQKYSTISGESNLKSVFSRN